MVGLRSPPKPHAFVSLPLQSTMPGVEFTFVLIPPAYVAALTQELLEIARSLKELLPQFAQALDHLQDSGSQENPTLTAADQRCITYSEIIEPKIERGRFIERELLRDNPRFRSRILRELEM